MVSGTATGMYLARGCIGQIRSDRRRRQGVDELLQAGREVAGAAEFGATSVMPVTAPRTATVAVAVAPLSAIPTVSVMVTTGAES